MKTTLLTAAFLAASALVAETTLTVNTELAGPIANTDNTTQTVTIAEALPLADGTTTVLEATLAFTLPSADPVFAEAVTESDRLVIAAKADGTGLLVSDKTAWAVLETPVQDNVSIPVRAEATPVDGGVQYTVSAGGTTVTVARPAVDGAPTAIDLVGVGSASALALKQVSTGVLPPASEGSVQDPGLVDDYAKWAADETKGGALAEDATDTEKQDAFAMNVGGTPKLEVVAIDTANRTITLKGSYVPASALAESATADLKAINGVLTITAQDTLSGEETVYKVDVKAGAGELIQVPFPNETARFVKATVDIYAPQNAGTVDGTPVTE